MKHLAQVISYIMHPFLMPLYILFFIFNGNSIFSLIPVEAKIYCYMVTLVSLLVMPILSLPLFRHFGLISNYNLESRQERVYPILVAVAFAFLGFWFIGRIPYSNIVQQLYLVLIILLSGFSIVTLRWKMSMHMTAIGGACAFLMILGINYFGDVRALFITMLCFAGLLAASRLYLEKHTPMQVYIGFLFGFCFVFGILY